MTVNEGATGEQGPRVEFPDDIDLDDFELVEEHKPYREWCVPASLINDCATVTLMGEDDLDEISRARWEARAAATTPPDWAAVMCCGRDLTPSVRLTAAYAQLHWPFSSKQRPHRS
jgi:hypothetical protein